MCYAAVTCSCLLINDGETTMFMNYWEKYYSSHWVDRLALIGCIAYINCKRYVKIYLTKYFASSKYYILKNVKHLLVQTSIIFLFCDITLQELLRVRGAHSISWNRNLENIYLCDHT